MLNPQLCHFCVLSVVLDDVLVNYHRLPITRNGWGQVTIFFRFFLLDSLNIDIVILKQ